MCTVPWVNEHVPSVCFPVGNVLSDLHHDLWSGYGVDFRDRFTEVASTIVAIVEDVNFMYIFS